MEPRFPIRTPAFPTRRHRLNPGLVLGKFGMANRPILSEGMGMNANTDISPPRRGRSGGTSADLLKTILAKHPFLEGLGPHQVRLLTDCAMLIQFDAGELIFREGDPANRFYLIHSGKVALESQAAQDGHRLIQTIGPGDVLGWSWLFPPYFWHLDARALEPTQAVFFYGTPLREECESDHDLGYELLKRMAQIVITRLQATRRQLLDARAAAQ